MLDMKAGRRWMARCRILISVLLIPGLSPAQVDKGASAAATEQISPASRIDINHASVAELETLPGIRDAYANAIIRHRPYQNKKQLSSRRVIPGAAYAKIKDLVIAKQ